MDKGRTDLSRFNNEWFDTGTSIFRLFMWQITSGLFFICHFSFIGSLKVELLRMFGAKVGKGVVIKQAVRIKYPWKLEIGDHVWIGECVWIENHDRVVICDNSCISQGAMLLCGNHDYSKSTFDLTTGPITLEQGVWIGARSVVCPGVTCGSHAVLTVNSVLSTDAEPFSIYRGNPAVRVRERIIMQNH